MNTKYSENIVLKQLLHRKSVRKFTTQPVNNDDLSMILQAALRAPTSMNGHQVSMIYTKDEKKIKEIAKIAGGQKQVACASVFVTFIIDFNRSYVAMGSIDKKQDITHCAEGILVGVYDAGIMLSTLQTAAHSLGYGTTAIGAIRENTKDMIKLLELPKRTFPICGTTIGVPTLEANNAPLKPRVSLAGVAMEDVYDQKIVKKSINEYEDELLAFRKLNAMDYKNSYKEGLSNYHEKIYFRSTSAKMFKDQGFEFIDG